MTDVIPHEAALTTTLKGTGKDAPWIVIRSRDASQLQSQLRDLEHGSAFTDLGRINELMNVHMRLGANLKATPMDPQPSGAGNWVDPTVPAANAQPNGGAAPAPATQPQSAPGAGPQPTGSAGPGYSQQPQQQLPPQGQPQFPGNSGGGMAQPMAPDGGQAPQSPQALGQGQQTWGNAVIPPATQQQMQQQQAAPTWTPPGAPAAQPPAAPVSPLGQAATPGAPLILGKATRFQTGSGAKGPWSAFFDWRSSEELASVPVDPATGRRVQTSDPNDPRLAAGQAEFCLWLR